MRRTAARASRAPRSAARSADTTRDQLVVAAAHLFARHGIEEVPLRDIAQRAGQRNASAVQYHFAGRWDLVTAILGRHDETVRGWAAPVEEQSAAAIVTSLVALLRPKLATAEGRDFLRIVFELMSRYPGRWDVATAGRDAGGGAAFQRLVRRLTVLLDDLPKNVARARAVAMTQFVTYQLAERARLVDEDRPGILREPLFISDLEAMALALLTAPPPAGRSPAAGPGSRAATRRAASRPAATRQAAPRQAAAPRHPAPSRPAPSRPGLSGTTSRRTTTR